MFVRELKENEKKVEDLQLELKTFIMSDTEVRGEINNLKKQITKSENSIERENNKVKLITYLTILLIDTFPFPPFIY